VGAFSPGQFDAVVNDLVAGGNTLSSKIAELPNAANKTLTNPWVPGFIKDSISWLVEKACAVGRWVVDKVVDLLKGAVAPVRMFFDAWNWMDVRQVCSGVAGTLKDTNLDVDDAWKGPARDAYVKHMKTHSDAAARCGTIADKAAISLTVCAGAGLAFYVALGVIVTKLIVEFAAAIIAVGTGVFSAVGAFVVITDAGITSAMIWAAVGTLTALLAAEAAQMVVMHGEATDGNMFPGGRWPIPGTQNYNDAAVLDGDTTDWYLEKR
jgi:hypothetical protein